MDRDGSSCSLNFPLALRSNWPILTVCGKLFFGYWLDRPRTNTTTCVPFVRLSSFFKEKLLFSALSEATFRPCSMVGERKWVTCKDSFVDNGNVLVSEVPSVCTPLLRFPTVKNVCSWAGNLGTCRPHTCVQKKGNFFRLNSVTNLSANSFQGPFTTKHMTWKRDWSRNCYGRWLRSPAASATIDPPRSPFVNAWLIEVQQQQQLGTSTLRRRRRRRKGDPFELSVLLSQSLSFPRWKQFKLWARRDGGGKGAVCKRLYEAGGGGRHFSRHRRDPFLERNRWPLGRSPYAPLLSMYVCVPKK